MNRQAATVTSNRLNALGYDAWVMNRGTESYAVMYLNNHGDEEEYTPGCIDVSRTRGRKGTRNPDDGAMCDSREWAYRTECYRD